MASDQVFHHHSKWEEIPAGMWGTLPIEERTAATERAKALMIDVDRFSDAMTLATIRWPVSCEASLTNPNINQLAFMGHAGTCIAEGVPEDLTRAAWNTLNGQQQDLANDAAARVVRTWKEKRGETCQNTNLELTF